MNGSECRKSLYESKFDRKRVTDLVGYYKTCNFIQTKIYFQSEDYYKALLNWKTDPRRCNRENFEKKIGRFLIKGNKKVFNEGVKMFKGGCRKNGIFE